jgi:hypothetical protein
MPLSMCFFVSYTIDLTSLLFSISFTVWSRSLAFWWAELLHSCVSTKRQAATAFRLMCRRFAAVRRIADTMEFNNSLS